MQVTVWWETSHFFRRQFEVSKELDKELPGFLESFFQIQNGV